MFGVCLVCFTICKVDKGECVGFTALREAKEELDITICNGHFKSSFTAGKLLLLVYNVDSRRYTCCKASGACCKMPNLINMQMLHLFVHPVHADFRPAVEPSFCIAV